MIEYKCKNCHAPLRSPDSKSGRVSACPQCGHEVHIPTVVATAQEEQIGTRERPERSVSSGTGKRTAGPKDSVRKFSFQISPAIVLASVSLLAAIVALFVTLSRDNQIPGKGLASYDFSDPKAAVRSMLEMTATGDVLANIQLSRAQMLAKGRKLSDAMETLEFDRVIEHDGKALVLYKQVVGGLNKYETQWFVKEGGSFYPTYVSTIEWSRASGDKAKIAKILTEWGAKEKP